MKSGICPIRFPCPNLTATAKTAVVAIGECRSRRNLNHGWTRSVYLNQISINERKPLILQCKFALTRHCFRLLSAAFIDSWWFQILSGFQAGGKIRAAFAARVLGVRCEGRTRPARVLPNAPAVVGGAHRDAATGQPADGHAAQQFSNNSAAWRCAGGGTVAARRLPPPKKRVKLHPLIQVRSIYLNRQCLWPIMAAMPSPWNHSGSEGDRGRGGRADFCRIRHSTFPAARDHSNDRS